jgi:hypothetical protein
MSRKPKSPGGDTDMRIGVSPAEQELLDIIESNRDSLSPLGSFHLVETGSKDAAAALRADPGRGMASRRRSKALEAAARLLLAVEQMDAAA